MYIKHKIDQLCILAWLKCDCGHECIDKCALSDNCEQINESIKRLIVLLIFWH